jgi:hypothetical protein
MGYASWPERIALWHYLIKDDVVNCAIDIDAITRRELHHPQRFVEMELTRIRTMAINIKKGSNCSCPYAAARHMGMRKFFSQSY